ncbi:D-isomer-specific 2-hydroxyacid dehydrogenase family protein [Phyllosticta capitalensis]|uniref:D-isomer-specific 2-hydroxyacid dehydrogenase family protein n=1 Tax=Phyllosticta capitalensis TaxID=121624 RepID=A0ABR1Z0K9_9PEZI
MSTIPSPTKFSRPIKVAILDDWQDHAPKYLKDIASTDLDVAYFPDTIDPKKNPQELIERLRPFEVITTIRERTPFPREIVTALPNLRLLLTTGMRNLALDLDAFKESEIIVAGTKPAEPKPADPDVPKAPAHTTQHNWALILALANTIPRDDQIVKQGGWQHELPLHVDLGGKTFACLGLGKLGSESAKIAYTVFGMRVLAWSVHLTQEEADRHAKECGLPKGAFHVAPSKEALFKEADILSVHYVLSERSRGIVGAKELALLKPSALFINTSRGPLVEEDALYEVLDKGKIRGAAMDVFWEEPLPRDSKWRTTNWSSSEGKSEVILTPHSGYASEKTFQGWWPQTVANLQRYLTGEEILNRLV